MYGVIYRRDAEGAEYYEYVLCIFSMFSASLR